MWSNDVALSRLFAQDVVAAILTAQKTEAGEEITIPGATKLLSLGRKVSFQTAISLLIRRILDCYDMNSVSSNSYFFRD